jgi:hypothetical protein
MSKKRKYYTSCPNCGHKLQNVHFCPECGQENHDLNVPLRHLLGELLETTLHLDSKSFRTITTLFLHPGTLTVQFNNGRRKRFVPPIRLYIFISFVFFLILALRPGEQNTEENQGSFNFTVAGVSAENLKGLSNPQIDSVMVANKVDTIGFYKYIFHQTGRLVNNPSEFSHILMRNISYMMFILMPLSAWFIFLLHRKRVRYYLECLIYSIHLHSFIFLLLSFFFLIRMISDSDIVLIAVVLYSLVYLFYSLRRVFAQKFFRTLYKSIILALLAPVSIAVCFLLTIIISIILY